MQLKNGQTPIKILEENSSSMYLSEVVNNVEEENEDINVSYSDASSYGLALSNPPPGMIKVGDIL